MTGTFILGGITFTYEPRVIPEYVDNSVIQTLQDGSEGIDKTSVKQRYVIDSLYCTAEEFDLLEGYMCALGNASDVTLYFQWRARVHDGITLDAKLNRILNKVRIESLSITNTYGSGTSETETAKEVSLTLKEV
jgi:hypothetical protein